jgi:hypothetical protein
MNDFGYFVIGALSVLLVETAALFIWLLNDDDERRHA